MRQRLEWHNRLIKEQGPILLRVLIMVVPNVLVLVHQVLIRSRRPEGAVEPDAYAGHVALLPRFSM